MRALRLAIFVMLFAASAFAQSRTLVVYLPDSPAESPKKLAESVTDFAQGVSARSGVRLELKFFRRGDDAVEYVTAHRNDVALVVAPQELLGELPQELAPLFRFARAGAESYHRVVVVRANDPARSLADLRNRTVTFVQPVVRAPREAPAFRAVINAPDDQTAAANVLTGGADAAIVSELNPLVTAHVGRDLRVIYTTAAIPLPVVAIRVASFSERERESIEAALIASQQSLAPLQVSSLAHIANEPAPVAEKKLELATVDPSALDLPKPSTTGLSVPVMVGVEVVPVALPEQ